MATHNKRMQPDFGKQRLPQPLMRGVMRQWPNIFHANLLVSIEK
jgi:hypothetical protein